MATNNNSPEEASTPLGTIQAFEDGMTGERYWEARVSGGRSRRFYFQIHADEIQSSTLGLSDEAGEKATAWLMAELERA